MWRRSTLTDVILVNRFTECLYEKQGYQNILFRDISDMEYYNYDFEVWAGFFKISWITEWV